MREQMTEYFNKYLEDEMSGNQFSRVGSLTPHHNPPPHPPNEGRRELGQVGRCKRPIKIVTCRGKGDGWEKKEPR